MPKLTAFTKTLRPLALAACLFAAGHAHAALISWVGGSVQESVTQQPDGTWRYNFSIKNDSSSSPWGSPNVISEYVVPYYSDSGISWLSVAPNWTLQLTPGNPFGLANAESLHFTADAGFGVQPHDSSDVFSFTSSYGAAKAPFEMVFTNGFHLQGDPSIPASPLALEDGLVPASAVPEPSTNSLMFAGLGFVGAFTLRKRRKSQAAAHS